MLEDWNTGRMEYWIAASKEFLLQSDPELWMGEGCEKINIFVKIKYGGVFNNYYDNAGSPGGRANPDSEASGLVNVYSS